MPYLYRHDSYTHTIQLNYGGLLTGICENLPLGTLTIIWFTRVTHKLSIMELLTLLSSWMMTALALRGAGVLHSMS